MPQKPKAVKEHPESFSDEKHDGGDYSYLAKDAV
jgi:hypothetical protein